MSNTTESSSFLSNTLKRRQQKRHEATKILQEGISSLNLSPTSNEQQQQHINEGGTYPLFNIDPESYLLDEGDERSMLEPNSYNNPNFKQTINVLFNWLNTSLSKESIIIRSFEDDLYDGYILGKLIEYYQPNIRLLHHDIPLSEESKKKTLERVLNYLETCFNQQNQPIKWTLEQIYNRDFIAILHLLLSVMKFFNIKSRYDLPKNLLLKVIVVKKTNGLLQTRIINECFIDDHERGLTSKTLERVLNYLETCFNQQNQPIKWTLEQIYNRDFIAILHLLLSVMKFFNIKSRYDLPKNLLLKVIVVKKTNGLLQTRIINECFIDDQERGLTSEASKKQGDLIDTLFDLAPDKLGNVEKILLNFINNQLNRYNIHIKQIDIQYFQDGLNLLYLMSNLENYFIILNKYQHKKPLSRDQSYANIQLAFQLMNQAGIDIEQYCRINDLLTGNQRTLYRLLFQLYLRYNKDSNNLLQSITFLQPVHIDSPFL
ncbi:unnamed protein product [Rotaria sp. Silwood1]|nr:unnamed protein product [Rotaria sp. Silwood1]